MLIAGLLTRVSLLAASAKENIDRYRQMLATELTVKYLFGYLRRIDILNK